MPARKRILVVESDAAAAERVGCGLEAEEAVQVELVGSLAEARAAVDRATPDLVVTALTLPDGRGTDLIPGFESVAMFPVVVMAASGDETTAVEAMKAGALDYVVKSEATLEAMPQTVRRALREWSHLIERRRAEIAFQVTEMRFRSLYDDNPSMFFTVERDGSMSSVNRYGAEMLGYEVDGLIGRQFEELYPEEQRATVREQIEQCFHRQETLHRWEARKAHQDGSTLWVRSTARIVVAEDGEPSLLIVCEDLTETRTLSEILNYESSHDSLTGVLNRREFERRLAEALRGATDTDSEHALCYVDLDQFQLVNETWGHEAGDELLRRLARLLQLQLWPRDALARLGGDEFGVLMEFCSLSEAQVVAASIQEAIESFRFDWEEQRLSVSAGIALVPIGAGQTISQVMRAVDTACYAAKAAGRNQIHLYNPEDVEIARRQGEMRWVSRILMALQEDRFTLYQQRISPMVNGGGKHHFEILLRMVDGDDGVIAPGAFLPAAERHRLIERLDRWVIANTLEWLAEQRSRLQDLFLCAINLSGHSLGNERTLRFLEDQIARFDIPPEKLCFEVTETVAAEDPEKATRFITALRDRGCHFALDDFGTGVSSFGYLRTLPVDFVKIDGIFVKGILDDPADDVLVASINQVAHALGKRTIAEYVEAEGILQRMAEIGVDYVQGFGVGRPQPIGKIGEAALGALGN
jgi:diguanylate cyclase (GGDEF)-like protein/PAS domain S-box-containing protein